MAMPTTAGKNSKVVFGGDQCDGGDGRFYAGLARLVAGTREGESGGMRLIT